MNPGDCSAPLHPLARRGLEAFNRREYFEAHELLEEAWREEKGPIRGLYQGILQAAVCYLHIERGNLNGGMRMYARCKPKLDNWPDTCRGVDVAGLRRSLSTVMEAVSRLGPENIHDFYLSLFQPISYDLYE